MRKTQLTLLLATMLGLTVLSVAPVAAETTDATSNDSTSTTVTTSGDSTSTSTSTKTTEAGDSTSTSTTTSESGTMPSSTDEENHVKSEISQFREEAMQQLQTERKNAKEHSQEARQQACLAHQAEIDTRIADYSKEAQAHLNVFSSIFTKVQTFYTTKHLSVSNYATLSAAVTTQQTAAQQAVDALSQLSGTKLDCTQPDPAQNVAALKNAVDNARTALQAYRQAITTLIVALKGASSAQATTSTQTTTTTGGNQ